MALQLELDRPLSVSQLTGSIQQTLEQNFSAVWVKGEISNLTKHGSGHWYFSLKDRGAQLGSVMFRRENDRVRFEVTHGMEVTVHGRISVYPPHGKYQLIVDQMLPAGQGDLHLAFEALKKKLHGEGAFDADKKQGLPTYPRRIGVITSPTGAAIRDMINILSRRFPMAEILVFPVRVQGDSAAAEISEAIQLMNTRSDTDVLIIGRGGGSLEDLWAFNEEIVARAILASHIPIISAVGHETDTTISDYIADMRAPTPSAAAELVVPDQRELLANLEVSSGDIKQRLWKRIQRLEDRLDTYRDSYALKRPQLILEQKLQQLDRLEEILPTILEKRWKDEGTALTLLEQRLKAVNPLAILDRGYAVVQNESASIIRSVNAIRKGDTLNIRLAGGSAISVVKDIQKDKK